MKKDKHIVISLMLIILAIILGSEYFLYVTLTQEYRQTAQDLETRLDLTKNMILNDMDREKEYSMEQRKLLKNMTMEGFRELENIVISETSKLGSEILDVRNSTDIVLEDLNQKLGGLENKISDIDVRSADFSSIIEDVVRAVVSVRTNTGQGSGVIYHRDGYVLTNRHVIEGANSIAVVDYESRIYPVSLIGVAESADLAVLKIDGNRRFDWLDFASSSDIRIGERVIAVGNPLGLSFTVTEGIISAVNRKIDNTGVGYIQTDVSINRGSSGGPLVNTAGEIVGITTVKIKNTEGIGFAVPADIAEEISDQGVQ